MTPESFVALVIGGGLFGALATIAVQWLQQRTRKEELAQERAKFQQACEDAAARRAEEAR